MADDGRVRRLRSVTAEELRVWRAVVRDAVPLDGRPPPEDEAPPAPAPSAKSDPVAPPSAGPARAFRQTPADLPGHGDSSGLDRATATRLRRGRLPVEAKLDLHGLTQGAAYAALSDFVTRSQGVGKRCVLVVTGKGLREGTGVLRAMVPRWLNEPALRRLVLGFSHARPKDGGEGALYVLLKRQRT